MNESAMKRPDTFTITTFWMDWLLQPIVLGAVWLTARWALADVRLASGSGTWGVVPAWGSRKWPLENLVPLVLPAVSVRPWTRLP